MEKTLSQQVCPPEARRRAILWAYILKHHGHGDERSFDLLVRYLAYYQLGMSETALRQELDLLLAELASLDSALFVCTGSYCRTHIPRFCGHFAERLQQRTGMPVHWTECLGSCNEAPSAIHKRGDQFEQIAPWNLHPDFQ